MTNDALPPPAQMMQRITGFWVSQAIGAIARLGIADAIASGVRDPAAIARHVGADPSATARLMRAAASIGLVAPDGSLTPLGETLRTGVPGSMREMAMMQTAPGHWLPWGRFTDVVRTGRRQAKEAVGSELWEYYAQHPDEADVFSRAMSNISAWVAPAIASVVAVAGPARVVDVGGAHGELLCAVLEQHPQARGVLLDVPHVAERARAAIAQRGLASRCEVVPGDFFASVPEGDVYLLKHILHDWDDAQCVSLLERCARAMRPDGRVMVVELALDRDGGLGALMDLNMLALLPGRERTTAEYEALFAQAGLRGAAIHATMSPFTVLEARRA